MVTCNIIHNDNEKLFSFITQPAPVFIVFCFVCFLVFFSTFLHQNNSDIKLFGMSQSVEKMKLKV